MILLAQVSLATPPAVTSVDAQPPPDPDIVMADDGTYTFRAPEVPPPDEVWAGGTWRYLGQATFSAIPRDRQGTIAHPPTHELVSPWESTRVDAEGRLWARIAEGRGGTPLTTRPADAWEGPVTEPPEEDGVEGVNLTWFTNDCGGGPDAPPHAHWDTDDRAAPNMNALNKAQKATVAVNMWNYQWINYPHLPMNMQWVAEGICSGTLLQDNYVLTAGHCLAEPVTSDGKSWVALPPAGIVVCTYGNAAMSPPNAQCQVATSTVVPSTYLNTGATDQDFGVAILPSAFTTADTMVLTTRNPATWSDFLFRNLAYPSFQTGANFAPTCALNNFGAQQVGSITVGTGANQTSVPLSRRLMFRNTLNWSEASMTQTLFRWRGENAGGASGSSMFFCPNGCNSNPEVFAILSSYAPWPATHRFRGPRVEGFAPFVLANAP